MIKCKLSQDEIMKKMTQKMVNIATAYSVGDMEAVQAECVSSICSGDEFYEDSDEIRFSNDNELEFYVDGRRFWCDVCVGYDLSNKDKYVIWGGYKQDKDEEGLHQEHALVEWYWGAQDDLEPGAVVPQHIIDACKKWLKKGE